MSQICLKYVSYIPHIAHTQIFTKQKYFIKQKHKSKNYESNIVFENQSFFWVQN